MSRLAPGVGTAIRPDRVVRVRCVIVGGGPAGIVLAYLLARAGVDVLVLEKHADFLRDFRGDTVHPSTLRIVDELGLLEPFLRLPHVKVDTLGVRVGDVVTEIADFRHLPGRVPYLALMPQWDLLDFFVREARRYPTFGLEHNTEAIDVLRDGGIVTGVLARSAHHGLTEVRADLVIATDGRTSVIRDRARLPLRDLGAPIDVLWLRLTRPPGERPQSFGTIAAGALLVTIDRGSYYQCALVIRKGSFETLRSDGIAAFRARIATLAPALAERVDEIVSWDDVKVLTVRVDRLERWFRAGVLCIGDAAHSMSPVGGVGINLAIQDAVATANLLAEPLRHGAVSLGLLRAVQRRRALPARVTQLVQVLFHRLVFEPVLAARKPIGPLPFAGLLQRFPALKRIPAYAVGIGFRPERVRSVNAYAGRARSTTTGAAPEAADAPLLPD